MQGTPSGTIGTGDVTVTYVYELKSDCSVTTKFVDENGKPLADDVTTTGKATTSYNAEPAEIPGYKVKETPSNATGTYDEDSTIVTYAYEKKDATVVVAYIDENGNEIASPDTINGKWFDSYTTEQKTIEGYELVATPKNASGEMNDDTTEVVYTYKKIETPAEEIKDSGTDSNDQDSSDDQGSGVANDDSSDSDNGNSGNNNSGTKDNSNVKSAKNTNKTNNSTSKKTPAQTGDEFLLIEILTLMIAGAVVVRRRFN